MSSDLLIGWALGIASSLITGLFMYWLEGKRELRISERAQRREDIRTARNWAADGRQASLRGFDLRGANLSGKDLSGADLEEANLEGAQMWATNLAEANLIRANFQNAKLVGVTFKGAKMLGANFSKAILREVDFEDTNLRRANLMKLKEVKDCLWRQAQIDETTSLSPTLRQDIERQK